jgi:hypothetical protein
VQWKGFREFMKRQNLKLLWQMVDCAEGIGAAHNEIVADNARPENRTSHRSRDEGRGLRARYDPLFIALSSGRRGS